MSIWIMTPTAVRVNPWIRGLGGEFQAERAKLKQEY